jgi:hypothetical protein
MKKAAPENGRFHPIAGKSRSTNEFRADFLWVSWICEKSFRAAEKPDAAFLQSGVRPDGLHKW